MVNHVAHGDALEIINLAPGEDGGDNLVFLGGGEDENHIARGLLEGFQESVESGWGEHVDLIDDKHPVAPLRRRNLHLLHELADVVDTIVGGGVKLYDVHGVAVVERTAAVALVACLSVGGRIGAVDCLGEDAGAGGLPHPARAAEEIAVGQTVGGYGIFKGSREGLLPHDAVEGSRTVFPRRDYIVFHIYKYTKSASNYQN